MVPIRIFDHGYCIGSITNILVCIWYCSKDPGNSSVNTEMIDNASPRKIDATVTVVN